MKAFNQSKRLTRLREQTDKLRGEAWRSTQESIGFADSLTTEALRDQLRLEETSVTWEWAGYLLYGVGWYLALKGGHFEPEAGGE